MMEKDLNGKTKLHCSVEFWFLSKDRENLVSCPVFSFLERSDTPAFLSWFTSNLTMFRKKKNIRCMAQVNHWCFDNTSTKNRNQVVFVCGLYIFDPSVECLPQHFRHGLHQIWQIDELFRARLKLWCATIKWPFRTGWPPAVLPNAWALIWLLLWSFLIRMSHWSHTMADGAKSWISCQRQKILRKAGQW